MDWNTIVCFIDRILGSVDWLANTFVVLITVYGFWRAFITKRVSVINIYSHHGNEGTNKAIMLKNHALREIYISEAYLIYDNKYAVHLSKWEKEPYVLNANGVCRFETKYYSQLAVDDGSEFFGSAVHIFLRTSEGDIIHAPFKRNHKINKKAKIKKIAVIREYYCDKIVALKCQYILHYQKKGEEAKIIQIWPSGVMSEPLIQYDIKTNEQSWFNGLPENALQNIRTLSDFFKEIFEPVEMDFVRLIERKIDEHEESKYSLDDIEEVTYNELKSSNFSHGNSGFRTEVTS